MLKDLYDELLTFLKGNTLDALIPTFVFIILSQNRTIGASSSMAITIAVIISVFRLIRKQKWKYALAGLGGVIIATTFAFLSNSTKGFFYPKLISNTATLFICLFSLIIKKPLAIWASHLSRGWNLKWYFRKDIYPAYQEVTFIWTIILSVRLLALFSVLNIENLTLVFLINFLLGTPTTIVLLILSYIYGIIRLRTLGGPSVDEFKNKTPKPWKGQRKGF